MAIMYDVVKVKPTKDANNPEVEEIPMTFLAKVEDKAIELLVKKIEKPEGVVITTGFHAEIMSWKEADGQAVVDKINEITAIIKKPATT